MKKNWKLEAGFRSQLTNSKSHIVYEEFMNGDYINISEFSNKNSLKEIITGAHGILYKDWKNDKIEIGCRIENTDASFSGASKQKYFKIFPTLYYQHDFNENYDFSLSYKKTITRTPYNEMVPYTIFINQYTIFAGNPLLKPQYDDILTLNLNLKKLKLSLNYEYTRGMFGQFPSNQNYDTGVTYFALQNLNRSSTLYFDAFYPLKITSWWDTQNSGTLFGYSKSEGRVLENEFKLSSFWCNFKTDQTIRFSKNIKCQIIGYYSSPYSSELTSVGPVGNIDFFFLANILNKSGQIRIGVNEVFKRNRYTSDQYFFNYSSEKFRFNDSRRIIVGFTYNFGKLSNKIPEKKLQNNDAINRIGQ